MHIISKITASLVLVALTPLIGTVLLVMLLVHRESPIFVQDRIGFSGRLFKLYKIKSFYHGQPSFLGRIIRKTSIDELLQLINIIKGDMLWVGPRPLVSADLDTYPEDVFILYKRMIPGLTGLFQISGRKHLSIIERAEYDRSYFYTRSIWLDIQIILKTIPAVLSCKGAA